VSPESVPTDRRYTKSHEWVKSEGSELTIGITDHAQAELTDIVFVDAPAEGKAVEAGASILVLESVKTVADVYAPVAGKVAKANPDLKGHPDLVNKDPYGRGWLVKLAPSGPFDEASLLSAEQYRAFVASGSPST
jgi:glycine cleavage system H protein